VRGGSRAGAGRPSGRKTRSKSNEKLLAAVRATKQAEAFLLGTGSEPFEGDAHALLVWAYKHPELSLALRIDAAKGALPYEKPRLMSIDGRLDHKHSHVASVDAAAALELEALRFLAAGGAEGSDGKPNGRTTH
jgi:hypothetical protein